MSSIRQEEQDRGLSKPCREYIDGIWLRVINQKNLKPQDREFFLYSGRWANEMGYYERCKKQTNMTYYNLQLGIDVIRAALGVCFSDVCTEPDWRWAEQELRDWIQQTINHPNNSYYIARDYIVVDFKKVYPADSQSPGFQDSYVLFFAVLVLVPLGFTALATIKASLIGKSRTATSFKLKPLSRDAFDAYKQNILKMPVLEAFNLRRHLRDAKNYPILSAGQLTVDIVRFFYCVFVFAYEVPFVHAEVSKISADAKENAYYNTGPADSNLQIVLFLPTGFLAIGGYTAVLSVLRAFRRQQLAGRRLAEAWWKCSLCSAALFVKRYLRHAVGFLLSAVFVWKLVPQVLAGPMRDTDLGCTDQNFWPSLLLCNNDFAGNGKRMCGMWLWYLAIDFRLFLLVPLIAACHLYSKRTALGFCAVLMVSSLTASIWYNQKNGIREVHPYIGNWMTDVMTNPYFNGCSYFFGVLVGLAETARVQRKLLDEAAEKSIEIHEDDVIVQQADDILRAERNNEGPGTRLFWLVVGGISLGVLSTTLYVYYCLIQNDDVDIRAWPQWRHTAFNTAGIWVIGVFPIAVVASVCHLFERRLKSLFSRNRAFGILRSLYFEMLVVGIPFLLTLLFALENVPFFDPYLVNCSIPWEICIALAIAAAVHFTVTKPIDILVNKIIWV